MQLQKSNKEEIDLRILWNHKITDPSFQKIHHIDDNLGLWHLLQHSKFQNRYLDFYITGIHKAQKKQQIAKSIRRFLFLHTESFYFLSKFIFSNIIQSGFRLTCWWILSTYSPINPRKKSCIPPNMNSVTMSVGIPW